MGSGFILATRCLRYFRKIVKSFVICDFTKCKKQMMIAKK